MPTVGVEEITAETMAAFQKATTSGVFVSTGIQGYDLSGLISQVPVNVPDDLAFQLEAAGAKR